MQKTKLLFIVGAIALLVIGAQIARTESGSGGTGTNQSALRDLPAGSLSQPQADTTPAPKSIATPPAQPYWVEGPDGKMAYVPAFKSDDNMFSMRPTGGPAIQPTIRDMGPNTPAFTEEDVVRYYNGTHPANSNTYGAGGYSSSVPTSIVKIEFLTERDLAARKPNHDGGGIPDDTLLCYVQYSGSFLQTGPPYTPSSVWPYAMDVYDAHTGNLMMSGTDSSIR